MSQGVSWCASLALDAHTRYLFAALCNLLVLVAVLFTYPIQMFPAVSILERIRGIGPGYVQVVTDGDD